MIEVRAEVLSQCTLCGATASTDFEEHVHRDDRHPTHMIVASLFRTMGERTCVRLASGRVEQTWWNPTRSFRT